MFASEAAWFVTDEAIQILGGMGYMRDCGLEKVMRDLRIFRIFEGTNDILRLFVALTGIQYAGGHLRELQKAVASPISNFGVVLGEVAKRGKGAIGISSSNMLADSVHPNLVESAAQLCNDVTMFGDAVEKLLIKHGRLILLQECTRRGGSFPLSHVFTLLQNMICIFQESTLSMSSSFLTDLPNRLLTFISQVV